MKGLVFVVDDDESIRESLCEILNDEGYAALGASNGQEAMELLRHRRPCLILLDLMMPVMDGPTFRAQQLQEPSLREIPVVVITAAGASATRGLMAQALLPKPLRIETVLGVAERFCPAP